MIEIRCAKAKGELFRRSFKREKLWKKEFCLVANSYNLAKPTVEAAREAEVTEHENTHKLSHI